MAMPRGRSPELEAWEKRYDSYRGLLRRVSVDVMVDDHAPPTLQE